MVREGVDHLRRHFGEDGAGQDAIGLELPKLRGLRSGRVLDADVIVCASGVTPATGFVAAS